MFELLVFRCCRCGNYDTQCVYCVNSIHIDPDTGLPLSVGWDDDGNQITVQPSPEALARSRKEPICDECVRDQVGPEYAAAARHDNGCVGQ